MELIVFGKEKIASLPNCGSFANDTDYDIPFAKFTGSYHATVLVVLSVFVEILYVPCFCAFVKKRKKCGSFRVLVAIGIVDILAVFDVGLGLGMLTIGGIGFCKAPTRLILMTLFATVGWLLKSLLTLLLLLYQCFECWSEKATKVLFNGHRILFWFILIIIYAFLDFFTTICSVLDLDLGDYGEHCLSTLQAHQQTFHNAVTFAFLLIFMVAYCITHAVQDKVVKRSIPFRQMITMTVTVMVGTLLFVGAQLGLLPFEYVMLGNYIFFFVFGCSPLIYLVLNTSIRTQCFKWMGNACKHSIKPVDANGQQTTTTVQPAAATAESGAEEAAAAAGGETTIDPALI